MNYVFSTLNQDFLTQLINDDESMLQNVTELLFKYFPLSFSDERIAGYDETQWLTVSDFKKSFESACDYVSKAEDPIKEMICMTFDMCKYYNTYHTCRSRAPENILQKRPLVEYKITHTLNKFFDATSSSYQEDLRNLLMLSLFYTASMFFDGDSTGLSVKEISSAFYDAFHAALETKNERNDSENKIVNRIKNFTAHDAGFLEQIFNREEKVNRNEDNNNSHPENHNKLRLQTIYDAEFLCLVTSSTTFKKNPFVNWNRSVDPKNQVINSNVKKFLEQRDPIILTDNDNKSFIKELIKVSKGRKETAKCPLCNATKDIKEIYTLLAKTASLYNNFFLERFTHCNFLNCLWKYEFNSSGLQSTYNLNQFCLSPLLKYRLKVIEFHAKEEIKKSHDIVFIEKWNIVLRNIINQQVFCTIPVMVLVFHYFFALYIKKHEIPLESMIKKLVQIKQSGEYVFYKNQEYKTSPKKTWIFPNKFEFPSVSLPENLKSIQANLIKANIDSYISNNLFSRTNLNNLQSAQSCYSSRIFSKQLSFETEDCFLDPLDGIKI